MRPPSSFIPFVAALLIAGACPAIAQTIPGLPRRATPQRTAEQAPPVPTVMRPAEGEVVVGDLMIAVQVPPNVPARRYTIEAGYWDPARNDWAYPGTLGDDFPGGTTATTKIAADMRLKWNQKATRWKIHVRTTEPPGGWGPWREFTWQAAPSVDRTTPAPSTAPPPPAATPTNTANPAPGDAGKPGIMVPGTTTPQPGTTTPPPGRPTATTPPPPEQKVPAPAVPNPGPPETRTAPPTPPGTNVPAVQQPPSPNLPAVQQPTVPAQPPPTPPSTNLPAVQQPPAPTQPQPPAPAPRPPSPGTLPTIPNVTSRLPVRPPTGAPSGTATNAPPSQPVKSPSGNPVNIVSRTKLEVWDGKPMPASNQRIYVPGPVDVDWAKKSLQWWFRAITAAPNAATGKFRWEMSRTPFPDFAAWQPIPGYGYTGSASGVQFFIALDAYAPRPPDWPVSVSASAQPAPTVAGPGAKSGVGAPPTLSQKLDLPADLLMPKSQGRGQPAAMPNPSGTLPASLSLYVRVVALDKAGNAADLPSNQVELRFGPSEKAPAFDMNPKYWPVVTFVSYRPVQGYTFDWQCWVKASKDITAPDFINVGVDTGTTDKTVVLFHEGQTRNSCEKEDSNFVDDFVDAVGGFVDLLGSFVDWVSKTYSSIKNAVISKVIDIIPGCSSDPYCKGAVQAGLNAGMAALGMPPDLPDFEQLQAMGEGYLVDAIAQQVASQTNLPFADEAAKAALKEFIEEGKEAMQGGSGSSAWIPDDSRQYKPLLLTLAVSNPSTTSSTPAMYLEVSEPGGSRYVPRTVAVPGLAPGQSVKVSLALNPLKDPKAWMALLPTQEDLAQMVLKPGVVLTKSNQAEAALKDWRAAYLTGTVQLQAALKLPPFVYKVAYQTSCFANKQGCLVQ